MRLSIRAVIHTTGRIGDRTWEIDYNATSGNANYTGDYQAGLFVTVTAVPEPSTWVMGLAGIACAGWGAYRRRRAR